MAPDPTWLDLLVDQHQASGNTVTLKGGASDLGFIPAEIGLTDDEAPLVVYEECFPRVQYLPPESPVAGSTMTHEYVYGVGSAQWQNIVSAFATMHGPDFSLVGRTIRVRAIPDGAEQESQGGVIGVGQAGFIFTDGSNTYVRGVIANFSQDEAWDSPNPDPLEGSHWFEHTVNGSDLIDPDGEFVGIGVVGEVPSESAPHWERMRFEWQILDETPEPPEPVVNACEEVGAVTRINASAHNRVRVHGALLAVGERRCVVVDFNGAVLLGRTIASVVWETRDADVLVMSNPLVLPRRAEITVDARLCGQAELRCVATFDNGERYVQRAVVDVRGGDWIDDNTPSSGPTRLEASA